MSCPPCRSLRRSFLSHAVVFPAAPLAASLLCFSSRRLARRAARCIARLFLLPTPCPPRRSLNRCFVSLDDALPSAPLAESLVSFSRGRHARRAARSIAHLFLLPTSCPSRRWLHRSFFLLPARLPPCRFKNVRRHSLDRLHACMNKQKKKKNQPHSSERSHAITLLRDS
jgi:hypothetical protein